MSTQKTYDVAIVGGGIVGLAAALALTRRGVHSVIVLEAEDGLARHQTGHNSGVIHSGLYYKPGSLKALNCVQGRDALYRFCAEQGVAHEQCGKIVVAVAPSEIPALRELERRGQANGLKGVRRLTAGEMREREPHVAGVEGLLVPETGIVNFTQVAETYGRLVREAGAEIQTGSKVIQVAQDDGKLAIETASGWVSARHLINCAGLQSDRLARLCGLEPNVRIVPFRGEYYQLTTEAERLVRHLIYPVPDPRFPFLGVHFTRMIGGGIEAGPNAVLALKREGYRWRDVSVRDLGGMIGYGGFWRMVRKYGGTGIREVWRSMNKSSFVHALQKLVPEISERDVHPHGAGVRAQAVAPDGSLVDDFRILEAERMVHVLNAPSPAATSSLSIGETVADMMTRQMK